MKTPRKSKTSKIKVANKCFTLFIVHTASCIVDRDLHHFGLKNAVNRNMTEKIIKENRIINQLKSKIVEIETADILKCLCSVLLGQLLYNRVAEMRRIF